ncbi:MAG: hypothetical protein IJZ84_04250 [Lachnospiraceae bacterium]|nr:hypothetical protein [Lachnospiraceae bacterium]
MKKNLKNYELDEKSKNGVRYVGQYYIPNMTGPERRKSGTLQMLAGAVELLLIILAISVNCQGIRTIYVIIPLELILFCSLFYLMGAYRLFSSGDRMEQKTYDKAIANPVQIVAIATVLNFISCLGQIVLVIRKAGESFGYADYIFLAIIIVLLALHIFMWKHQRVLYNKVKVEQKA